MSTLKVGEIKHESFTGTTQLKLDSAGRLGIGTTSPSNALDVQGGATNTAIVARSTDSKAQLSLVDNSTTSVGSVVVGAEGDDLFLTSGSSGSERMRIDSSGNVGIGTTSPSEKLDVEGTIECLNELRSKTGNDLKLNAGSANRDIFLQVNDSTLMTVQGSTGRVGIGTTSPASGLHIVAGNDRSSIRLENTFDTPDNVWELQPGISGVSNTGFCIYDVTDSANRFVIDGSGNVGIGTTSPGKLLHVDTQSSSSDHFIAEFTGINSTNAASLNFFYMGCGSNDNRTGLYWEHQNVVNIRMWMDDGGTLRQSSSNPTAHNSGTAFSYAGGSDYRLKTNVVNYTNAITELKQLKPYKFNYIETDRTLVDKPDVLCSGFYAHEAGAVVPSSLLGEKDEIDFEGNPVYQSLKYEKFVPLLTAALQEAIGRIEALEAK